MPIDILHNSTYVVDNSTIGVEFTAQLIGIHTFLSFLCISLNVLAIYAIWYKSTRFMDNVRSFQIKTQCWFILIHITAIIYAPCKTYLKEYELILFVVEALLNVLYCGLCCSVVNMWFIRHQIMATEDSGMKLSGEARRTVFILNYFVVVFCPSFIDMLYNLEIVVVHYFRMISTLMLVFTAATAMIVLLILLRRCDDLLRMYDEEAFMKNRIALKLLWVESWAMWIYLATPYFLEAIIFPNNGNTANIGTLKVLQLFSTNMSIMYNILFLSINSTYRMAILGTMTRMRRYCIARKICTFPEISIT